MFINIQGTRIRIKDIIWYGKRVDGNFAIIIGLQGKSVEFDIDCLSESGLEDALLTLDNLCSAGQDAVV